MSKSVGVIREGFIEEVMLNLQLKQGVGSARKGHFRQRGQHILQQWGKCKDPQSLFAMVVSSTVGSFHTLSGSGDKMA